MRKIGKILFVLFVITAFAAAASESVEDRADASVRAIPGGVTVGLKMYIDGLLVVGFSEIPNSGSTVSPGKAAGLQKGDRIMSINGKGVGDIKSFAQTVQEKGQNPFTVTLERDGSLIETKITPVYYNDAGQYKIGVWVRDSAAGIGTLTFMLSDGSFAALGHGVSDIDTAEIIKIKSGKVCGSRISSVVKGQAGVPGELRGAFDNSVSGEVTENCNIGIYGKITKGGKNYPDIEIEHEENVSEGNAVILANIDGNKVEKFTVEIQRVMRFGNSDGKCMIIKITDPSLLERTGGIVQGMSGCPVIKDGRIAGAITHVFLNDPTRGYAIFAERLLKNLEKGKN